MTTLNVQGRGYNRLVLINRSCNPRHKEYVGDHRNCIIWIFLKIVLVSDFSSVVIAGYIHVRKVLCLFGLQWWLLFFQLLGISMLLPLLRLIRHSFRGRLICLQGSWNMVSSQLSELSLNVDSQWNKWGVIFKRSDLAFTAMGKITGELVSGFINTFSRRATSFPRQANWTELLYEKNFPVDFQTRQKKIILTASQFDQYLIPSGKSLMSPCRDVFIAKLNEY